MKKLISLIPIIILVAFASQNAGCSGSRNLSVDNEITSSVLADNIISLYPDTLAYPTEAKSYKWNYEQGLVFEALYRIWKATGNDKYYNYIKKNIDYYVEEDGRIKTYELNSFNIDNVTPGRVLIHLFNETKDVKYKKSSDTLYKQLTQHPRTSEGGFWHKKIYPYQMWLDGLYMAEPFYSEYSKENGLNENYKDIAKQFLLIKKNLYDANTGLYYHGWDEKREQKWADPVKGTSPNFWGRSIGWFLMALVDVLDTMPEEVKEKSELKKIFVEIADAVLKYKDSESGLWFQVLDKGNEEGNYIETSASSMFIYGFAKGFNKGYLPEKFKDEAIESFSKLCMNKLRKGVKGSIYLTNVCSVGGLGGNPYRDGSFKYYISEPQRENDFKGYGALLLASLEVEKSRLK